MEKINTPLMAHIEFLKTELYPSMPVGQRVIIKRAIKNAESLLPTEREVMIKCAEYDVSYMALKMHDTDHEQDCECKDCADMQHETAVAYVNENFKSYE